MILHDHSCMCDPFLWFTLSYIQNISCVNCVHEAVIHDLICICRNSFCGLLASILSMYCLVIFAADTAWGTVGSARDPTQVVVSTLKRWTVPLTCHMHRRSLLGESLRLPEIPVWRGSTAISQMCCSEVNSSVSYLISRQLVVSSVHQLAGGRSWTTLDG